jgi:hypothetical protein
MSGINSMLKKAIGLMAPEQLRATVSGGQLDFFAFLSQWAHSRARKQQPEGDIPPQLILMIPDPDKGLIYERVEVVAEGSIWRLNRFEEVDINTAAAAYVELSQRQNNG